MGKTLFEKIWAKHLVKTIPVTGEQGMVDIKKTCLLQGYDNIDYLMNNKAEIEAFDATLV